MAAIQDHALLSDCRASALVTRDGTVDWWPSPRFDSASAFSALSECHARAGRLDRAHAVYERAAGAANDLGLLAEQVDPASGEPLGNVPQTISHVGLINAAQALTEAEARAGVPS